MLGHRGLRSARLHHLKVWSSAVTLIAACLHFGCGDEGKEDDQDTERVALCEAGVRAETCFGDPPPDFDFEGAADYCVDTRFPAAEAFGAGCEEALAELLGCLEGKECQVALPEWFEYRSVDGNYACSAETASFRGACPGLWFAPE